MTPPAARAPGSRPLSPIAPMASGREAALQPGCLDALSPAAAWFGICPAGSSRVSGRAAWSLAGTSREQAEGSEGPESTGPRGTREDQLCLQG